MMIQCSKVGGHSRSPKSGFALVEYLAVAAVLGLLAGVLVPTVQQARRDSRETTAKQGIQSAVVAGQTYEPPQACCLPTFCVNVPPSNCEQSGGYAYGPNTVCGQVNCNAPGACCHGTECSQTTIPACLANQGDFRGPSTSCTQTGICGSTEACCRATDCADIPRAECLQGQALPQGAGTSCSQGVCRPQACCGPEGRCALFPPGTCRDQGGNPRGEASDCLGDPDGDGIDEVCPAKPCEECGPGPHWIHNPACPPGGSGFDTMPSGAVAGIDIDGDCIAETNLILQGPVTIGKRGPKDDSDQYPGLRPTDGHLDVIDTEMLSMNLTTFSGERLIAGEGLGALPLRRSSGAIAEVPADPSMADSFFDVFFELSYGAGQRAYNVTPIRVRTDITCLPPDGMYVHVTGCTPLFSQPGPNGVRVGNLVSANHFTYPACCLGTQCIDSAPSFCQIKGGRLVPSCLGDNNQNGVDDACDGPCRPTPDGQRCEGSPECDAREEICRPRCATVNVEADDVRVDECSCAGPNECGVQLIQTHLGLELFCAGGCAAPEECVERRIVHADGSQTVCCGCAPEPEEACCGPEGRCERVTRKRCLEIGGTPLGPDAECEGDSDENGRDDACQTDSPCEDCGPGPHWMDQCRGGADVLSSSALIGIALNDACDSVTNLVMNGPAVVARSNPSDSSVRYLGMGTNDEHLDVIDTEMTSLQLVGTGVAMRAGAGMGVNAMIRPSFGVILEQPGDPAQADSFFDVFVEVELVGGQFAYNQAPLRVRSVIDCVPPNTTYIHLLQCIPLFSAPTGGTIVAYLTEAKHGTYPTCGSDTTGPCVQPHGGPYCDDERCCEHVCSIEPACCSDNWSPVCANLARRDCTPQACCLPDRTCEEMDAIRCRVLEGVPQGPSTTCDEVNCGGVVEVDHFPLTTAVMEIRMPDGALHTVALTGPTTAHVFFEGDTEGDASDQSGNGLDEVRTRMVDMELHGVSSIFGPLVVRLNPDRPTNGEIEEKANAVPGTLDLPPFTPGGSASSFFDVFFDIEIVNTGIHLFNQTPKHMSSQISHKPPAPGDTYVSPVDIPLFDANGNPTGIVVTGGRHTPNPPIEVDQFADTTAVMELQMPDGSNFPISLHGPTRVQVFFEGAAEGDAHDDDGDGLDEVATEMVSMNLHGNSPFGPVSVQVHPSKPSRGQIEETANTQPGRLDLPPFAPGGNANSFFDVFFEIQIGGQSFHTQTPKRMSSVIHHKPPAPGDTYENPEKIPLLDANGNPTGISIGAGRHTPNPAPQACCLPIGACEMRLVQQCLAVGGIPLGDQAVCLGDNNVNGRDDACETDSPCDDCGPGPHWVDTCRGGADHVSSSAIVGIAFNDDCVSTVNLVLFGPATVARTNPRDASPNYPALRPVDGHIDVIDTEMTSLQLVGGGATLTAGRGMGSGGLLPPTLGAIAEQGGDPANADSFFDVWFEIQAPGGQHLFNHSPLRVRSEINCVPPTTTYIHAIECVPLFDAPFGGNLVAYLTEALHGTFPTCGSDAAGDCFTPHAGPYCSREECCQTVCGLAPNCCETGWGPLCATLAREICEAPQACCLPNGGCKEVSPGVCELGGGRPQGAETNCASTTCPPAGDCDGDGDSDLGDFAQFQNCFGLSGVPTTSRCGCSDLDGDGDVDGRDFLVWQRGNSP